jgi:mono/diheme cytochrome c family protein
MTLTIKFPRILIASMLLAVASSSLDADDAKPVTYDDHIAPIFKRHCFQCHGESKQEAGLNLASFAAAVKGGSGGAVVVAGRSSTSRLLQAITAADPAERMPPENDPLPKEQVALIKTWIETGLRQNAGSAGVPARTLSFTPTATFTSDGPPPMPENLPAVESAPTNRPFPILALAASPRAPLAAVAGYQRIDFINPETRDVTGSVPFPEGEPHVLRFSRSGAVLLAAGGRPVQNGSAVLFDVKTGKRLAELGNETDAVIAADISADERLVAIGGSNRIIKVFSTTDGSLQRSLVKHTDWVTAIAFSPDGKLLASADRVGNIHLWDAANGGVVLPLSEHKSAVRSLAWRSDSQVLASCGEDGLIVWWEVAKGWPAMTKSNAHPPHRPAGTYGKIANGVLDAAFGPSGELVTCGRDRAIRVWAADGNMLATRTLDVSPASTSTAIRIFPLQSVITFDGTTILAGDSAGQLHSWANGR